MRNSQLIESRTIPVKDKNKQVVKMLNTRWPLGPGGLGVDTDRLQDQGSCC